MSRFLLASTTIALLALSACAGFDDFDMVDDEPVRMVSPEENAHLEKLKVQATAIGETNKLNSLARLAIDLDGLYDTTATKVDDPELKSEVQTAASSHRQFATDLQQRVSALGGEPAKTGDPANTVELRFADTRVVQDDNLAAASQVARAENLLIEEIGATLQGGLSPVSQQLVEAELNDARQVLQRMEAMRTRIYEQRAADIDAADEEDDEESPG